MPVLLYASEPKLEAITGQQRWIDRLDASLTVGVPGVGANVGLRPSPQPSLVSLVQEAKRRIAKEGGAASLSEAASGRPPPLFAFQGPAARMIDQGVLWIAGLDTDIPFLLAGSAANAIGTVASDQDQPRLSASADPVGTIRQIFQTREVSQLAATRSCYLWRTVVEASAEAGGLESAAWVAGFAVYAGRSACSIETAGADVVLIIGSPLFIEQV